VLLEANASAQPSEAALAAMEHRGELHSRPPKLAPRVYTLKALFQDGGRGVWGANIYTPRDLLPLRRCKLNGQDMWCPAKAADVLEREFKNWERPGKPYG